MAYKKKVKTVTKKVESPRREIHITLNPSQLEAFTLLVDHTNKVNEVMLTGPASTGKSWFGCWWLIWMALQLPNTRYMLARSHLTDLKKSTLVTFFKVMNELNFTTADYTYNQQENTITFLFNNSQIVLKDLAKSSDETYSSLGSQEYTACYIDEVNLIESKAKNIVLSRLRWMHKECGGLIPKLLMTCNPSKGWCYSEFYKPYMEKTLAPNKSFVQSKISDNLEHTPQEYLTMLEGLDPASKMRLLDGNWDYDDDGTSLIPYQNILSMFKYESDINKIPSNDDMYISMDIANVGVDTTCIICWNGLNVIEIVQLKQKTNPEILSQVKFLQAKYNIPNRNIIYDADGGYGVGVGDYIIGSVKFRNNGKLIGKENFENLKTQCIYAMRDSINKGEVSVWNLTDEKMKGNLTQELGVIRADKVDSDMKLCVIRKEEVKSIIGRSPDFSDAFMMRWYFVLKHKKNPGKYYVKVGNLQQNQHKDYNWLNDGII